MGTITPTIGPDQSVRSGMGSGWYKLCGKCHGKRSASTSVAPPSQPPMMCPHSCVVVMVHHPTSSSPLNLIHRFNFTLRSMLIATLPMFENQTIPTTENRKGIMTAPFQSTSPLLADSVYPMEQAYRKQPVPAPTTIKPTCGGGLSLATAMSTLWMGGLRLGKRPSAG